MRFPSRAAFESVSAIFSVRATAPTAFRIAAAFPPTVCRWPSTIYLRRIHAIKTELVGVPELPFAEYARRIRIDPTVAVPIINMFAENN